MTYLRRVVQACFVAWASISFANAHEFWIDPVEHSVAPGDKIEANLRVGENMKGSGLIFNPRSFTNYSVFGPNGEVEVTGRLGDRPALQIDAGSDGLHVVAHMTTANTLKYAEFKKFASFAKTHGQDFAIEDHKTRNLPDKDFREGYFRCAKALIKVGSGAGQDRTVGLPFELTALSNPYTDDGAVRMRLTFKGRPKPGHQVDIFHKDPGAAEATMTSLITDAKGEVEIPRKPGDFMLNAVLIEPPSPSMAEKLDVVWISLWASTTYSIE